MLNVIEEGTGVIYRGYKAQTKVKSMYFQVKFHERNFGS